MPSLLPLVLFGVFLNAGAQILLKMGMSRVGHFDFAWGEAVTIGQQIFVQPTIWLGLMAYAISVVIWLMILSRLDVSYAYPMVSLGYIMTAFGGWFLFDEHLNLMRIMAIMIIIFGVFLLSRS